mgnify:CR=1 FL=1
MNKENLRDDILVSVCFSDASDPDLASSRIERVVDQLKSHYRYWEILVVNETGNDKKFIEALTALPNLRHLSVFKGIDNMQRRVVAASEAIGDVVLLTSIHEVDLMDLTAMIDAANEHEAIVLGQRKTAVIAEPLIGALGRASGFEASTRDMQTVAYPRTMLNRLLGNPNPALALRFPPRDNTVRVLRQSPNTTVTAIGGKGDRPSRLVSRFDLLLRMVTDAGPALLGVVALLSAAMFVGALLFTVYVVIVYLTYENVAEGWTTLSLAISGMLSFLGIAFFGLCITLRKMAEIIRGRTVNLLVAEKSSVDLFESVANTLNVDTDASDHDTLIQAVERRP